MKAPSDLHFFASYFKHGSKLVAAIFTGRQQEVMRSQEIVIRHSYSNECDCTIKHNAFVYVKLTLCRTLLCLVVRGVKLQFFGKKAPQVHFIISTV